MLTEKLLGGPSFRGTGARCGPFVVKEGGHAGQPLQLPGDGSVGSTELPRRGFSCEVSVFISAVGQTKRVRQMNIVETTSVIVHASPPSMP